MNPHCMFFRCVARTTKKADDLKLAMTKLGRIDTALFAREQHSTRTTKLVAWNGRGRSTPGGTRTREPNNVVAWHGVRPCGFSTADTLHPGLSLGMKIALRSPKASHISFVKWALHFVHGQPPGKTGLSISRYACLVSRRGNLDGTSSLERGSMQIDSLRSHQSAVNIAINV